MDLSSITSSFGIMSERRDIHATLLVHQAGRCGHADLSLYLVLQHLHVRRRMLVQYDEVGCDALQTQVLVGVQHLAHHLHVLLVVDAGEDDGQIATDAVRPQVGLHARVARQ